LGFLKDSQVMAQAQAKTLGPQPSKSKQCSENYYRLDEECRRTQYDSLESFNNSFISGNAVKTYNIYPIYLGTFTTAQRDTVNYFLKNVGASTWYYKMMNKAPPSTGGNKLVLKGVTTVSLEATKRFMSKFDDLNCIGGGTSQMLAALRENNYPNVASVDSMGIYIFLIGPDVPWSTSQKWKSQTCGSHTFGMNEAQVDCSSIITGIHKKRYINAAFPSSLNNLNCIPSALTSPPNGNKALDAMINVVAHELIETVSGYDIGNQCVYQFASKKTQSGSQYTELIGGKPYFIQKNFNYKTQRCL